MKPRTDQKQLLAFVFVNIDYRVAGADAEALLARIPEAQEVHRIAGEDCYLVKLRVANSEALGRVVQDRIETINSVCSTRTTVVLKTVKQARKGAVQGPAAVAASF